MSSNFRSPALRLLGERGYINQCTDLAGLDQALAEGPVPVYIGFDATATSLHAGHLVPIMCLRALQRCGHKPIVLIGGGTSRIGDPSFRNESRPLLSDAEIARNKAGIERCFAPFIRFGDKSSDAIMVDNADWLDELRQVPFLRDVGRHFTVNRMLALDSVKARLERGDPLSFLEFNYMVLQAFDFLELSRRFGCRAQMGGSDQWGNIVNGVDLVRRIGPGEVFGLTTPLLTTRTGAKMGKSTGDAVWLDRDKASAYEFWQFWRNTDDPRVGTFLRLFTELPLDEIDRLERLGGSEINAAKEILATEVTGLAHGSEAAGTASATARQAFEGTAEIDGLPIVTVTRAEIEQGLSALDLLVRTRLCTSKSEARRLIAQGGLRLDGIAVDDPAAAIRPASDAMRVSVGRKRHAVVKID